MELTKTNEKGREKAIKSVEDLALGGCTNLWDGLYVGMETIKKSSTNNNAAILLFTDGMPNVDPPRGYIPTL